ncbi:MAG: hypothetical protein CV088_19050 [Nitrospira sp. LK70]|nr:hypothetical protein [Nitrospira sp. LK70]
MTLAAIIVRVHCVLEQRGTDCSMEELVTLCPELTWNQVFLAIDYLSRSGQIRMMLASDKTYKTYRVQAYHSVAGATIPASPAP